MARSKKAEENGAEPKKDSTKKTVEETINLLMIASTEVMSRTLKLEADFCLLNKKVDLISERLDFLAKENSYKACDIHGLKKSMNSLGDLINRHADLIEKIGTEVFGEDDEDFQKTEEEVEEGV